MPLIFYIALFNLLCAALTLRNTEFEKEFWLNTVMAIILLFQTNMFISDKAY